MPNAIEVNDVYKSFRLPHEKTGSLKQSFVKILAPKNKSYEKQQVLKGLDFEIKEGEFFGIVGRNGSGKSTLLKILASIYTPDKGSVTTRGKLTAFIELGVGFNPELTGKENIYLNGALLGFDRKRINGMYDEIVAFAELENFMDQKLKNYSSGMQVRLAFSIAVRAKSDILLIDEVLAVGDSAFQRKCYDHFMSLKKEKKTVVLVTHDMGAVRQYCDRAIMIEQGEIVKSGPPSEVAQAYQRLFMEELEKAKPVELDEGRVDRWGTGKLVATTTKATIEEGNIIIDCSFIAKADIQKPVIGFTIYNPSGVNILEGNTRKEKVEIKEIKNGQTAQLRWKVPNIFSEGKYTFSVGCADESMTEFYDWVNEAGSFRIISENVTGGVVDPPLIFEKIEIS